MGWSTGFTPELKRGVGERELTMLTEEQLLKIEQDAQKATPGPWRRSQAYGQLNIQAGPSYLLSDDDAAHIENCDPQTVMGLVKMARRYLYVEKHARCDPKMDGNHVWLAINLRNVRGPTLGSGIDSAIDSQRKDGDE